MPARCACVIGLALFLIGACDFSESRAATPFILQNVSDGTAHGQDYASVAFDPFGNPHVSYYDSQAGDLRYATRNAAGVWSYEVVDTVGVTGLYSSLVVDARGVPHISYFDDTNDDLRYARKNGSAWVLETVESAGNTGLYTSIGLESDGTPIICFEDASDFDLGYANKSAAGTWSITHFSGADPRYLSIAVDGDDATHVFYSGGNNGFYAKIASGGASISSPQLVLTSCKSYSLAVDKRGLPHLAFFGITLGAVLYARRGDDGVWTTETIETAVGFPSLRLDAHGAPRVSFAGSNSVRYAVRDSAGTWTREPVEGLGTVNATSTALALDAQGNPSIIYTRPTGEPLRFASSAVRLLSPLGGERWAAGSVQTVKWSGWSPASDVSLSISYDGGVSYSTLAPAVASNEVTVVVPNVTTDRARIRIHRAAPPSTSDSPGSFSIAPDLVSPWWTKPVIVAGTMGDYPSLALDAQGSARVTYQEGGDLKYASKTGGTVWTAEAVDIAGTTGLYTSLALDAQGVPRISYYDQTNGDLKYAFRSGVSWATQTVHATGTVGQYTSLALDAAGNPRISYYDVTNGDLRYASYNGVTWTTETADAGILGGNVGQYTSLALNAQGDPRISYYDVTSGNLRYASKTAGAWTLETVDSPGTTGQWTSLALDAQGNPRIAYHDATNGDLRYASRDNGAWTLETVDASGTTGLSASLALDALGNPRIAYSASDKLRFASRTSGVWTLETIDTALSVSTSYLTSLRLDAQGNARVIYADAIDRDLRYASTAIELALPLPGDVWPVGASRAIAWDGAGRVSLSLSTDGGDTWRVQDDALTGGSTRVQVPHSPSKFAKYKIERAIPRSVARSDLFTIQSSIALAALSASLSEENGALITWSTDPGPADLAGYRVERRNAADAPYTTIVPLTKETSYRDPAASPGASYRLHGVNGLGEELLLGETSLAPARTLAAWPLPCRSGELTIALSVARGEDVRVDILDAAGRLVRALTHSVLTPGQHTMTWDARDSNGHAVANGVYVLRSRSSGQSASLKALIAR